MTELFNPFAFAQRIKRPLILDGAMGSFLQQMGFKVDDVIWTTKINNSHPQVVTSIHKSYIDSGADIITTNTFRTNLSAIKKAGLSSNKKFVKQAVEIAFDAKDDRPILVAGSNPPAEDCYQSFRNLTKKELQVNHCNHIDLLYNYGIHFILNETQSHLDEIKIICKYCSDNSIPFIVSLFSANGERILSGELISEAVKLISDYVPIAIGFNCISIESFKEIKNLSGLNVPWGFYLNCGARLKSANKIRTGVTPEKYTKFTQQYLQYQPAFVGACCGSTPEHIKAIKRLIDG